MNPNNESVRLHMYKARGICPGAVPASKEQRVKNLNTQRRNSRWGEMLKRRNIPERTLSPIYSPSINDEKPKNTQAAPVGNATAGNKKKLEMLKKWQQEKKMRLEKEKARAKPLFKVHHVTAPIIFDLDAIYKQIKGQPIAASSRNKNYSVLPSTSGASTAFKKGTNKKISPRANKSNVAKGRPKGVKGQEEERTHTEAFTSGVSMKRKTGNMQNVIGTYETSSSEESSNEGPVRRHLTRQTRTAITIAKMNSEQQVKSGPDTNSTETPDTENEALVPSQKNKRKTRKSRQSLANKSSAQTTQTDSTETVANGTTKLGDSDQPVTPLNKNVPSNVVYVSPFVIMSRGSENARKEYHHRRSTLGGSGKKSRHSPYAKHDESTTTSPKAAANFFYKLLLEQTERLQSLCKKWNSYKEEQNSPEEVCDMINVAIGQTDLLLQKKFKQFKGLIQNCESENSERRVTCIDLHGFWDTMMIQVDNLDQRFDNLERLKHNNWEEILPVPEPKKKGRSKKQASKKQATSSSGLKAHIQAARKKKEAGMVHSNPHLLSVPSTSGVSTPAKTPNRATRSSLRVSVLSSQSQRKLSSPGLTMMKVSQLVKSADKSVYSTPLEAPRSILKVKKARSSSRKSKVVLFKDTDSSDEEKDDQDEDKENKNSFNLMDFSETVVSKTPLRRSSRMKNK